VSELESAVGAHPVAETQAPADVRFKVRGFVFAAHLPL
jgi:hypothetical protein